MTIALRTYLVLIALANGAGLVTLALNLDAIQSEHPRLGDPLVIVLFASGLVSLLAVALIWLWRRAGLYLIVVAYAVMLLVNLYYGAPLAHTLLGPVGLGVLFALVWPVRGRFPDSI